MTTSRRAEGATQPTRSAVLRAARIAPAGWVFVFGCLLYGLTLAPGVLPADSGEFQVTGALLGVAHPPGFALYTVASWLASRLPGVAPAASINALSAVLAAATLALVYRATAAITGRPLAALAGALLLGFSTTFWAQATTANIRMPTAFAVALCVDRLVAYRAALRAAPAGAWPRAQAAWLFLALGLAVAHHASTVFVAAVLGAYALWLRPSVLRRPWAWAAGALPFLSWLYFPLRAGAFGAPPRLGTWAGFWEHVLARGFAGDMFHFATAQALPERLQIFANTLTFQFTLAALLLAAVGAAWLALKDRGLGMTLLAAVAAHVFVSITYRAPQTVEYLMPAWVLMAVWMGAGAAGAWSLLAQWPGAAARARGAQITSAAAVLLLALVAGGQFLKTFPSYAWLARDTTTRDAAQAMLDAAPPNAAVLAAWHWATPLWYLQRVEGQRPDVDVRYVTPQSGSLAQDWVAAIRAALPVRPVLVTNYFEGEYAALPYRFVPAGPAWEVREGPVFEPPPGLAGEQAVGEWTWLGHRLQAAPGRDVSVLAAWRAPEVPRDVGVFVHLLDPSGQLHSQHDVRWLAGDYAGGEMLAGRYSLPVRPDAPAGAYTLVAGVYDLAAPTGPRLAEVTFATLHVPLPELPPARVPAEAVPLGSAVWVTSSRIAPGGPVRPGDEVTVAVTFTAARPITADYAVGVSLTGPNGQWRAQSDGTPAGGAIPTLKWIAGSRVVDVRTLRVPPDAAPGTALVSLTLYDAFTQQVLAMLDPVLAAQGPALPLGTLEVAPP